MRTLVLAGSAWFSRNALARHWAQQDASRRADLIYQLATLATAALLLITAVVL